MSDEKSQIFKNGWGTRILTSTIGILLASAVGTSFAMYRQLGEISVKLDSISERMGRIDDRVRKLEERDRRKE